MSEENKIEEARELLKEGARKDHEQRKLDFLQGYEALCKQTQFTMIPSLIHTDNGATFAIQPTDTKQPE